MPRTSRRVIQSLALSAVLAAVASAPAAAQDSKSAATAKQFAQALEAAKLDAMAAADPSSPDSFVAAIYIAQTQLLVVAAKYAAPSLLADKIRTGDFRGVYMDLHAAATSGTKVFVQDVGPDGLVSRSGNNDSWEEGNKTTTFDRQWKKTKTTEADYLKVFADADDRYAKMLSLLLAQARQPKGKV
jgi:hypothetical protein